MTYDIFYLLNELDLLEIRLNILNPVVDYFVIVEATKTFSGHSKPLSYSQHKERFKKWKKKIIYFVINDWQDDAIWNLAANSPNIGKGEQHWVREFYVKESAKKALKNLDADDICYVSDLDEIWNPKMTVKVEDKIYKPKQLPYLYWLNNRTDEDWLGWSGTIIAKYEQIRKGILNHLRTDELTDYVVIENGGWHFNALGGAEKKLKAFNHPEYVSMANKEINMRKDETDLPEYLLANKQKWKQYFL